ncbi:MAG: hypothetical protein AB8B85_09000 [Paracoccaceae bacterium]
MTHFQVLIAEVHMPISYGYFGDPPILCSHWTGSIESNDVYDFQTRTLKDRIVQYTACYFCDLSAVTSIDVDTKILPSTLARWEARRADPDWPVLKVFLVPDPQFLEFPLKFQRMVAKQTREEVRIVSEQAAALALIGRPETTLVEFFENLGPPLPRD